MVVLEVFSKNLTIVYKSTLLSRTSFLVIIFGILSIIIPFILAYKSKGLWIKRDTFYEQPDVHFKGEYLFIATTNYLEQPIIICSSIEYYQTAFDMYDTCSGIKVREIDNNFDKKVDEFELNLQIYLPNMSVNSGILVVPLAYKLKDHCQMEMESALIYQTFMPISLTQFTVLGQLRINQNVPLKCSKRHYNNFYNKSIFGRHNNLDKYKIEFIINEYSSRNISTEFTNIFTTYTVGQSQKFVFNLKLKIPEDHYYYEPNLWQILKWAWIQYFAIYIIVSWVLTVLKSYIFSKKMVLYYEQNPIKQKN